MQAKIKLRCDLCSTMVEENYAKSFEKNEENLNTIISELKDFCKKYGDKPMHVHNCFGFQHGLLRAVGFDIKEE